MSAVDRYGPYELVRRLGSGGMAETFLAVRRGPGAFVQHVCVKRILPALEADPEFVRQFLEEARLAAQLRHASIAQVVDFGEVFGSHYLALELVDGVDLRALLAKLRERGERLPIPMTVHVGIRIAGALAFAHTPGARRPSVIHRDVSPSNVLLSRAGEVYLTDFGVARAIGGHHRTESGVVRGKVPYMAAEYARTGHYDARTDLFSLGVVLFEALAGVRPFDGKTDLDTLQRIQEGQRPRLAALAPTAPAPLVEAVERLLAPEPADRFATAGDLMDALAAHAPPPTVERELGQLVRDSSESLSASLRLPPASEATTTAPAAVSPGPAFPDVEPAPADALTRTSSDAFAQTLANPTGTEALWSSTDPTRISHHDRPSPLREEPAADLAAAEAAAPTPAPPAASARPPLAGTLPMQAATPYPRAATGSAPRLAARRPRGMIALLVGLGLIAFVIATAGTYALVHTLTSGP